MNITDNTHSRNMAFHDGNLYVLKEALLNPSWISLEKAVSLVTSRPARWLNMDDVGLLLPGKTADISILSPDELKKGFHSIN